MTPYWERRVEGQRFSAWASFTLSFIVFILNLLKLLRQRPLDGWDYLEIVAWGLAFLYFAFALFRQRRRIDSSSPP